MVGVTGTNGKTSVAPVGRAGLRRPRAPRGGAGHAGQRPRGRARRGEEHHPGPGGAAAGTRRLPAPRREGRGDGSLEPRPRPGARGRDQVRRRGVHEPHAGSPRLPRNDGGLRRGQVPVVQRARGRPRRDQRRRRLGKAIRGPAPRIACRRDRLRAPGRAPARGRRLPDGGGAAPAHRGRLGRGRGGGAGARRLQRLQPAGGDRDTPRERRGIRRRARRRRAAEARAGAPRAPGRRQPPARGHRLRAHPGRAREGAGRGAPRRRGRPPAALRVRLRRRPRRGQAADHGRGGRAARRPRDRDQRQPARRGSAGDHRPGDGGRPERRAPRRVAERQVAIFTAIHQATPGDVVLLAGKGHETYQEIAGVRHPFSDAEVALAALEARPR